MNFYEVSYSKHKEGHAKDLEREDIPHFLQSWLDKTTADYWRHERAYEFLEYLAHSPNTSWLTVGDGRMGLDSIHIKEKGFHNVLPTDISPQLLEESKNRGYISDYAIENAECLTFKDESFDYVFCKESLHHFPRPYLALYEMLRVVKKGVFIIEPNDSDITNPTFRAFIRTLLKSIKRKMKPLSAPYVKSSVSPAYNSWEPSGNYLYTFSRREAEKMALGLNLDQMVMKGYNDFYIEGGEFEPADTNKSLLFRNMLKRIKKADRMCSCGITDYNMLMVGFLKSAMDEKAETSFKKQNWTVIDLPKNPYL